jgi:hypothetical protein
MGVLASGWRHITQVCHKILVALLTMVLRIGDMKFDRTSRDQIANIMQLAVVRMLASGGLPARRARTVGLIAVFFDHLCFGQIFDPLIFDIRLVLARTVFFRWLFGRGGRFHPASLLQNASFGRTVVGRLATVSRFGLYQPLRGNKNGRHSTSREYLQLPHGRDAYCAQDVRGG